MQIAIYVYPSSNKIMKKKKERQVKANSSETILIACLVISV